MEPFYPQGHMHTSYIWAIINMIIGNSNDQIWKYRHNELFIEPKYRFMRGIDCVEPFQEEINTATYNIRPEMHRILNDLYHQYIDPKYVISPEFLEYSFQLQFNLFRNIRKNPYKSLRADFFNSFREFPAVIHIPHNSIIYCGSIGDITAIRYNLPISWERDLWEFIFSIMAFIDEDGKRFYPELMFTTAAGNILKAKLVTDRLHNTPPRETLSNMFPRFAIQSNYAPNEDRLNLYPKTFISEIRQRPIYFSIGLYSRHPSVKGVSRPKSQYRHTYECYVGFEEDLTGTKIPVFKWGGLIMNDEQAIDLSNCCLEHMMFPEIIDEEK